MSKTTVIILKTVVTLHTYLRQSLLALLAPSLFPSSPFYTDIYKLLNTDPFSLLFSRFTTQHLVFCVSCLFSLFPTHPSSLSLSLGSGQTLGLCQGAGCCQDVMALLSPLTQTEGKRPAKPKSLNSRKLHCSVLF